MHGEGKDVKWERRGEGENGEFGKGKGREMGKTLWGEGDGKAEGQMEKSIADEMG